MINSNSVDDSKRKKAIRKLENYIKTKYIFIDTCSLLEPSSYIFWSYAMEFLEKYNKKITIPYKCIEEIERHEKNLDNQSLAKKAKETKKLLGVLKKKQ